MLSLRRSPLALLVVAMIAVLAVALVGLVVDPTEITGRPAWLKPAKFAISTGIYAATLLWMLSFVRGRGRLVAAVAWVTTIGFIVEIGAIVYQAARGQASHFNNGTPFDAILFAIMGLFIILVWIVNVATGVALLRQRLDNEVFATGLRLGVALSAVAMLLAVPMIANGAHTVGAPDGGPGIPVFGWSTVAGDLRIAHFLGLHGMQVLPLVAWFARRVATVWIAGAAYFGATLILFWQAMRGQPLLSPDAQTVGAAAGLAIAFLIAWLWRAREEQPLRAAPSA
jgi:hypothetical protein